VARTGERRELALLGGKSSQLQALNCCIAAAVLIKAGSLVPVYRVNSTQIHPEI